MEQNAIVIGAGIGGMSSAIRLAARGFKVIILEARSNAGGLAPGLELDGFWFDAGPYILLDKPGLYWAFKELGIDESELPMSRIQSVYHVTDANNVEVAFDSDLIATAERFEKQFPGAGKNYREFVGRMTAVHHDLQPLTFKSHPGPLDLVKQGAVSHIPFLLSSLGSVLKRSQLPPAIQSALSIWTHIAGQPVSEAPSPMAFVPGLFHNAGSYYPKGGMRAIAALLEKRARQLGVEFRFNTSVGSIITREKVVQGVQISSGEIISAAHVISNCGLSTYIDLLDHYPSGKKKELQKLPLQSPGVCLYMAVKGKNPSYYLRFKLDENGCRTFVQPGIMDDSLGKDGWFPARLISPLPHDLTSHLGESGQQERMQFMLDESWWKENISDYKVLYKRSSMSWGKEFHLYNNSMNPVMTSRFMRKGRIAHASKDVKGLYLAGSATHPGQWVSFCAISGVLAADHLIKDFQNA